VTNTTKTSRPTRLITATTKSDALVLELGQTVLDYVAKVERLRHALNQAGQAGDAETARAMHQDIYYEIKNLERECSGTARKLHKQRAIYETARSETPQRPPTKKLVVIQGKGTDQEKRIETDVTMYWSEELQQYVTIPPREEN